MEPSKKILIADPDQTFCQQSAGYLKSERFEVAITGSGLQANAIIDAERLAGIIVSIKLNGMSGLQVANTARTSKFNSKVPIFIIAEKGDNETAKRVQQMPGTHLITRPVVVPDLLSKLLGLVAAAAPKAPKTNEAYDIRIINAFLEALQETLTHYFGMPAQQGKVVVKKTEEESIGFLSSMISFTGEKVKGSLALTFQRPILDRLAAKIFADNKIEKTDSLMADLAGEMGNQVCGAVKIKFAKIGLKIMIGLPKVVIGERHKIVHIVKNPVLLVPFDHANDKCSIEFCMDKNNDVILEEEKKTDSAVGGDVLLF